MIFSIRHQTRYRYSNPVLLGPQQLRFRPRDSNAQRVINYQITLNPTPLGMSDQLDLEGNWVTQIWFGQPASHLDIDVMMEVEALAINPFNFILSEHATRVPVNHDNDSISVHAYLQRAETDAAVTDFAQQLSRSVNGDSLAFLDRLNRQLFSDFSHLHRESGIPQSPALTLQTRRGACRDLAVLFVDCCRAEGIAARFASGYQKGNLLNERRDLHAWPEVYLPGAGWLGFDPTHGEPVAGTHVTVSAAANARDTMPVIGAFNGDGVSSSLDYSVRIKVHDQASMVGLNQQNQWQN